MMNTTIFSGVRVEADACPYSGLHVWGKDITRIQYKDKNAKSICKTWE